MFPYSSEFSFFTFFTGIQHQGSDELYEGGPCNRGHLFSAMTASGLPQNPQSPLNAANSARSTYQYTNAVPQCKSFNMGQWRVWEGKIRTFALNCTAAYTNCVMYLITGVSFVGVTSPNPPQPPQAVPIPVLPFPNQPNLPVNPAAEIDQPNSFWTVGNCVPQNGQAMSFAVIANNVPVIAAIHKQQIPTAQLMAIIETDITINGLKRSTVKEKLNLFPGITNSRDVDLPEQEYPLPANKKPPGETSSSSPQSPKPASLKPASPKMPSSKPASPKVPISKPASPKIPSSQPASPIKKSKK